MYGINVNFSDIEVDLSPIWVDYEIAELVYTASKAAAFPTREEIMNNYGNCGYSAISCRELAQSLGLTDFHTITVEKVPYRDDYPIHWANCHFYEDYLVFVDASPYTSVYKVSKPIPIHLVSEKDGLFTVDCTRCENFGLLPLDIVFEKFRLDDNESKLDSVMQATATLRNRYPGMSREDADALMLPFINDSDVTYALFAYNELATYYKLIHDTNRSWEYLLEGIKKDPLSVVLIRDLCRLLVEGSESFHRDIEPIRTAAQQRCDDYFAQTVNDTNVLSQRSFDDWLVVKRAVESYRKYVAPIYNDSKPPSDDELSKHVIDKKLYISSKKDEGTVVALSVDALDNEYRDALRSFTIPMPDNGQLFVSHKRSSEYTYVQSVMLYFLLSGRIEEVPWQPFQYRPYL